MQSPGPRNLALTRPAVEKLVQSQVPDFVLHSHLAIYYLPFQSQGLCSFVIDLFPHACRPSLAARFGSLAVEPGSSFWQADLATNRFLAFSFVIAPWARVF